MIGRRPYFAIGNSIGDRQMLESTKAGGGSRLALIVLHDDATREYAYGPAQGLPDTKVGTFTQALYDDATNEGWFVVSKDARMRTQSKGNTTIGRSAFTWGYVWRIFGNWSRTRLAN
jgi:hypothetical protein